MVWPTSAVQALATASTAFDPPNIVGGSQATTTVSCPGAALGDFVLASFSLTVAGITVTAFVSAADTVTVVFFNGTGADINLGAGTLRVKVFKQ